MAYARFGADGSTVYVFLHCDGFLQCCMCDLDGYGNFWNTADLVAHLRQHQAVGDVVPDYTFVELALDSSENDQWIAEQPRGVLPPNRETNDQL